jgi:vancomycin permeability regulator SanA
MHPIKILAIGFIARKVEIHSALTTHVQEILARIAALLNVAI